MWLGLVALCCWMLSISVSPHPSAAQLVPALASRYECSGETPDGRYQTTLTIVVEAEYYVLDWRAGRVVGLGIREADRLAVAFVERGSGTVGVAMYQILPGQLLGRWSIGDGALYREDCLVGQPAA